jgi:hypothetical protein
MGKNVNLFVILLRHVPMCSAFSQNFSTVPCKNLFVKMSAAFDTADQRPSA